MTRNGRWSNGGGEVRGIKISKRAKKELKACREIYSLGQFALSKRKNTGGDHTSVQASKTTGNQGLEYKIAQYTMVTRNGNVTTVEYKIACAVCSRRGQLCSQDWPVLAYLNVCSALKSM